MKKVLLLLAALLIAALFTELLVNYIVRFPKYGVDTKLVGIRSSEGGIESMFFPYSSYWTVEGGNRVFQRNNLGLPGTDVVVSDSSRYVFVLGCSFIEAAPVPPDSMATAVFQRRLSRIDPRFQVINLGHSGHDLYDSYFRSAYYERMLPPEEVILEVHGEGSTWLPRHRQPLTFTLPPDFGTPVSSLATKAIIFARDQSSLLNMIGIAIKADQQRREDEEEIAKNKASAAAEKREPALPSDLLPCLEEFHEKYKEKFLLLSMLMDARENAILGDYCRSHGLKFVSKDIVVLENRTGPAGHLNVKGNKILGEFLYGSFLEVYGKR
jgi:hypothetical protein